MCRIPKPSIVFLILCFIQAINFSALWCFVHCIAFLPFRDRHKNACCGGSAEGYVPSLWSVTNNRPEISSHGHLLFFTHPIYGVWTQNIFSVADPAVTHGAWASEGFFTWGTLADLSSWLQGETTVVKFHFTNSKLREKHLFTKTLKGLYQIFKF